MAEELDDFPNAQTWPDEWFNGSVWRITRGDMRLVNDEPLLVGVQRLRSHARRVHEKKLTTTTDRVNGCAYIRADDLHPPKVP